MDSEKKPNGCLNLMFHILFLVIVYINAWDLVGLPFEVVTGRRLKGITWVSADGKYGISQANKLYDFTSEKWIYKDTPVSTVFGEHYAYLGSGHLYGFEENTKVILNLKSGDLGLLEVKNVKEGWKEMVQSSLDNGGKAYRLGIAAGLLVVIEASDSKNEVVGYTISGYEISENDFSSFSPEIPYLYVNPCSRDGCVSPNGEYILYANGGVLSTNETKLIDFSTLEEYFWNVSEDFHLTGLGWTQDSGGIYVGLSSKYIGLDGLFYGIGTRFPTPLIKIPVP